MKLADAAKQAAGRAKRKTVNYNDILSAVQNEEAFEFLEGTIKAGSGTRPKKKEAEAPAVGEVTGNS